MTKFELDHPLVRKQMQVGGLKLSKPLLWHVTLLGPFGIRWDIGQSGRRDPWQKLESRGYRLACV